MAQVERRLSHFQCMSQQQNQEKIEYFTYCRKSSEPEERQALSIPSQIDKANEMFADLKVVETLSEEKSAFLPYNRPVFANMIKRIKAGEAQGIIAWHPDRLARNEIDAATITYMIRTGEIKDLKFGSYHFDNSPEGIMMLQIAMSQSQYSSAKLSKDVKRGLEKKVKMGWLPGVAPQGYLNSKTKNRGENDILNDSERFPLVRKMWNLMLTGNYTPPQILDIANNEWGYRTVKRKRSGGNPLSRSGIYKIFTNPFYYGWFEYPAKSGIWHKGSHESMITQEEFDQVQLLLGRKGRQRPHERTFAFTGLIVCDECGSAVTAEEKNQIICTECKHKFSYENKRVCPKCHTPIEKMKKPTILKYVYYHCTRRKNPTSSQRKYIEVKELQKQINEYLSGIQINQKYLDWALNHLRKANKLEIVTRNQILEAQQKAYNETLKELDTVMEKKLLSKNLTPEEAEFLERKKQTLLKEKERYQEQLKDIDHRVDQWLELSERTFNFSRYARFWFDEAVEQGDLQKQREIFNTLGSNLRIKNKKLQIEPPEPFEIIKKGLKAVPEAKFTLEPAKIALNERKRAVSAALNPRWRWVQDSNVQGISPAGFRNQYLAIRSTHPITGAVFLK